MKKMIFLFTTLALLFTNCQKDDDDAIDQPTNTTPAEIMFTGDWTREFEAGPGNLHTVKYSIYQDSIRYTLSGPIGSADYVILRDTFLLENNRFVGHTSADLHYLIFVKELGFDSISIYKQEIIDVSTALTIDVPHDTTVVNHGWNTYSKK